MNHILCYEPRIEGHHLIWFQLVCDILLDAGYTVSIAIDDRTPTARQRIEARKPHLLKRVNILSAFNTEGKLKGGSILQSAALCLQEAQANDVFFNCLDEFTSKTFRKAILGLMPPKNLKGKISGIFVRPRVFDPQENSLGNRIKKMGCQKLCHQGWFKNIFLLNEYLEPEAPPRCLFLPDPWEDSYSVSKNDARTALHLKIDQHRLVLLHYGVGHRRKGLHLILEAIQGTHLENRIFLIVGGDYSQCPQELTALKALEEKGCAKIFNYFISSPKEEAHLLCAADLVMLPYINHYGSSTVLSRAAAADRPVLASNFHLTGQRVEKNNLGFLFKNNNALELRKQLEHIVNHKETLDDFTPHLQKFAAQFSKAAFKDAILKGFKAIA